MTDDPPPASAAWQDVRHWRVYSIENQDTLIYLAKEVDKARAADAQQIAHLRDQLFNEEAQHEVTRLNLVAQEQSHERAGQRVIQCAAQLTALRAENEELKGRIANALL